MDEHRTVSLSRTYAPQRVRRLPLAGGPRALRRHRARGHRGAVGLPARARARASGSRSSPTPVIELRTDERLRLGEFGIETRHAQVADAPPEPPRRRRPADARPHDDLLGAERARRSALDEARARAPRPRDPRRRGQAVRRSARRGATIGRSRECDVVLGDSNVSRRHAGSRSARTAAGPSRTSARPTACRSTARASTARTVAAVRATGSTWAPSSARFEVE